MPAAIGYVSDLLFNALVFTGSFEAAAIAYGAIYAGVSIIATIGLSIASKALAGKKGTSGPSSRDVTIQGTISPRQLIYGEARTGGVLVYYELGGPNGIYLFFVIAVAGHQCDAIEDVWLDSRTIKSAEIDPSTGVVASSAAGGSFWNGGNPELWIWKHLGTSAQTVDATLTAACPAWDSTHRGASIAYIVLKMQHNEPVYPNGAPSSIFSLVRGRRLYDPRLDSTNGGTGAQRYTDATTWTWSDNWALAVRDYLSGGSIYYDLATPNALLTIGESNARIEDSFTITAANHADEVITVPASVLAGTTIWTNGQSQVNGTGTQFTYQLVNASYTWTGTVWNLTGGTPMYVYGPDGNWYKVQSVTNDAVMNLSVVFPGTTTTSGQTTQYSTAQSLTTTQPRYTCDGQISCGDTHAKNITDLLTGGIGHLTYAKGKYRIYAGVYDTPSISLGADDLTGSIEIATHPQGQDLYNLVTGTFYDELRGWQQSTFPAQQSASYQADDGGVFRRNVDFPLTRTSWRAQRMANCLLLQSRNKTTVTLSGCGPAAMNIAEWETFLLTIPEIGWSNQILRCLTWKFLASGFVEITARTEASAAYADLAIGNYQILAGNSFPLISMRLPDAPLSLTAATIYGGIVFLVSPPASGLTSGSVFELWEFTSSSPFSSATHVADFVETAYIYAKLDAVPRYYWCRVRDRLGNVSATFPSSTGVLGVASMPGFTLSAIGACNCFATQAIGISGLTGFNARSFQSNQSYAGGAFVTFSVSPVTGNEVICGLSPTPAANSLTNMKAGWIVDTITGGGRTQLYYNGGTAGTTVITIAASDVFTVFFDGFWFYWIKNGNVALAIYAPDPSTDYFLFGDLATATSQVTNIAFGPVTSSSPSAFTDIGQCVSHNSTSQKIGGSSAWDSASTSIKGYAACHLQGRVLDITKYLLLGLTTTPKEPTGGSARWDYCIEWNVSVSSWYVLKAGTAVAGPIATNTAATDVPLITYDGATVNFLVNNVSIHTESIAGKTFFGGVGCFDPGAGAYMLEFGPGTTPDSTGTFNIDANAATATYFATGSGAGSGSIPAGFNDFNQLIGTSSPAGDATVIVTAAVNASQSGGTIGLAIAAYYSDDGVTFQHGPMLPLSLTPTPYTVQGEFSHSKSRAGLGWSAGWSLYNSSGGALTWVETGVTGQVSSSAQAEFIRR